MLSEEERREILAVIAEHSHKHAAALDALKIVQHYRRWVSDELTEVADLLDMTPDELDGIATFFSQIFRSPVGKHVIMICDSVSCWVMGYEGVVRHLKTRLGIGFGETTADGQFTLIPVACLGVCDRAPAILVDDRLYTDIDPAKIDDILKDYQ